MSTWEERMAQRARTRPDALWRRRPPSPYGMFERWRLPGDPDDILPEVLAARCLGISYGDPGPRLKPKICRECWGDRHVWLGNAWGVQHVDRRPGDPLFRHGGLHACGHACHEGEVWLAS